MEYFLELSLKTLVPQKERKKRFLRKPDPKNNQWTPCWYVVSTYTDIHISDRYIKRTRSDKIYRKKDLHSPEVEWKSIIYNFPLDRQRP